MSAFEQPINESIAKDLPPPITTSPIEFVLWALVIGILLVLFSYWLSR